ncbi:MAG: diguanylate cyclase [Actinobacteria bacterium]|nr:diguanylate cyclase [Actinomycetota bacterium]
MSGEGSASHESRAAAAGSLAGRLARAFHVVLAGIGVTALITLTVFGFVAYAVRPRVQRYVRGAIAVRTTLNGMIDQETGIRGYLLTGQSKFLQPYRSGVQAVAAANDTAVRELGGQHALARPLVEMRVAQQTWTDRWATVALNGQAPAPGLPPFENYVDQGKALFDRVRSTTATVLARADADRDHALQEEGTVLAVGVALDALVLALVSILATRQFRRLRRAVVQPVNAMIDTVARLGEGDFDVDVPIDAPEELRRIGDGLVATAAALEAAQDREQARQDELEQQSEKLTRILAMSREIAGSLNLRYVLQAVSASAASVGEYPRVRVWIVDDKAAALRAAHCSDGSRVGETLELGRGVVGEAAKYGRAVGETETGTLHAGADGAAALVRLALPMVVGARVVGVLECENASPAVLERDDLDVLETLSSHAATAIEAARLHSETTELTQTDALTRLSNRRRLDDDLVTECYRSQRYGRPLAVIMLDVDHFKRFNDTHGHQRGDEVLEELGKLLTGVIRASDTAYRYGGEEFTVLCREATLDGAAGLAERLRARLEQRMAADNVTASFGVAAAPADGTEPATLVGAADRALYAAKRGGRNRVVTSAMPLDVRDETDADSSAQA